MAFSIAWLLLAQVNFGYSWWHKVLAIQQVSEQYGPQNRYRKGFELTDKAEHVRLFAAINTAVHHQGQGLIEIQYHSPNGEMIDNLLHQAEIVHLQDVADLIDRMKVAAIVVSFLWLGLVVMYQLTSMPMPALKQQLLGIGGLVFGASMLLLLSGPVKVFYAMHDWVFPAGHQWFFYYQDSLMSTLMKAPDLFGAIGVLLTGLALLIFGLLGWVLRYLLAGNFKSNNPPTGAN